ncbi:MAG TPA: transketolase C-terminal domain-containing protein, partial [Candidatus Thermoplasmatota archaeon]|nr:transketolase C-terminal domain-containing protein [Candidatus Thermoplasmatota archaeon]
PGSNAWEPSYNAYGDPGGQPHRVALPGEAGGRHYSNSTEHSPNGFTTEDPATRTRMVERRLERMRAIAAEAADPLVAEGAGADEADVVLVSWGSTVEACREAGQRLLHRGVKARVVGVRLLWPFPREAFAQAVGGRAPLLIVEANAFAQLARLIRSELPLHARMRSVLQYDGRTIASDAILAAVAP